VGEELFESDPFPPRLEQALEEGDNPYDHLGLPPPEVPEESKPVMYEDSVVRWLVKMEASGR
jgi:hypothetical protein